MNTTFPSLFSLVFVIIGAVILRFAMRTAEKSRQSESWPSTEGAPWSARSSRGGLSRTPATGRVGCEHAA